MAHSPSKTTSPLSEWIALKNLSIYQYIDPTKEAEAYDGDTPLWSKLDIEPLRTRRAWKKRGRRIRPQERPTRIKKNAQDTTALFRYQQTLSEQAFLETRRPQITQRCQTWHQNQERWHESIQQWLDDLEETPAPEAEGGIFDLFYQKEWLQNQWNQLKTSAARLDIPLKKLDTSLLIQAKARFIQHRLDHLIQEHEDKHPHLIHRINQQLCKDETHEYSDLAVPIMPFWEYFGRFHKAFDAAVFAEEVSSATRIHEFHNLFAARKRKRHFTLYLGPTNSGKTYQALQRLAMAERGVYLAPLRLLALEVAETLNAWDVPCHMITGEERIEKEGAKHSASTVEMLSLSNRYDLCVIDESQMLGDAERGWAWTQAILGVQATEVCVIGAPESRPVLEKLLRLTDEPFDVVTLERLTPLKPLRQPIKQFTDLKPGTAVISFSRATVLRLKEDIERATEKQVAVLYGALPPEVRRAQAARFSSGEAPYLVASDAIGMGLNLPIKTILFHQDEKYYNQRAHPLTPMAVRQIAGRAGRFGKNEIGFVGTLKIPPHKILTALKQNPAQIQRAHLAPNLDHLHAIAQLLPKRRRTLARLLSSFAQTVQPDPETYKLAELDDQITLARITDRYKTLDISTRFALSAAPVPLRSTDAVIAFEQMVRAVAKNRPLSLAKITADSRGHNRLRHLETNMQIVNLYSWLHYRFGDVFPDLDPAQKERKQMNREIHAILAKQAEKLFCIQCGAPMRRKTEKMRCPKCAPKVYRKYYRPRKRRRKS
ncbi:SUV3 domain-containing protein [Magnetococcales bacterium HHB-1]